MKARLLEILSETNGRLSSTRVFMLMVALTAIIDWQKAIWTIGVWNPNPEVLLFILGVLGLKVYQKRVE